MPIKHLPPKRLPPALYVLALFMTIAFAAMAWLSVATYHGYNLRSFDLGNMSQAIWSVTEGRPLIFTTEGFAWSRLAYHVELAYFLLVPLYALWSTPVTLLIVQALLFALGAIPVFRLAQRRLKEPWLGLAMAAIYLLYPVAQTAVLFNFHSDTLAMPLLLWALDVLDQRRWRRYAFWLALALSCKFYVAVPVAALGFVLWLRGERKAGAATMATAVLWGSVAFLVIRPLFPSAESPGTMASAGGYLEFYFLGRLDMLRESLVVRLLHGGVVLLPALMVGLRGWWWLLVAASVILPVLLSNAPGPVYNYQYHHYALAVPFIMMALIEGAQQLRRQQQSGSRNPQEWRRAVFFTLGMTLVLNVATVDTPLNPRFYLAPPGRGIGLSTSGYLSQPRDRFKDEWVGANVPPGTPVAADDQLGSRLINRPVLYRTHLLYETFSERLPYLDYVVVDALYDFALGTEDRLVEGGATSEHETIATVLQEPGWSLQEARDGLLLFSRGGNGLRQEATLAQPLEEVQLQARFGQAIGLLRAEVVPLGEKRFRLDAEWIALKPLAGGPPLMAVSRPGDLPFSRIVHLPTLGLLPAQQWPADAVVREVFEFKLSEDTAPGNYPLMVGWYRADSIFSAETDRRTRVGDEVPIATLEVR